MKRLLKIEKEVTVQELIDIEKKYKERHNSEVSKDVKCGEAELMASCKRHIRAMLNEDGLSDVNPVYNRKMSEIRNPHGGYIEVSNLFPFRTEKLNAPEPMVLQKDVGE